MKKMVVAILKLSGTKNDYDPNMFGKMTAKEKIDFLSERINDLMLELIAKEPNSIYVIAWHEYGITAADSRYVTPEDKKYLKHKMSQLAKLYPNLVLVCGTMAVKKFIPERSKFHPRLESIQQFYKDQSELELRALRKELDLAEDEDISSFVPPPDEEIEEELEKIEDELENKEENSKERCLIENCTVIVTSKAIYCHVKDTPHKETYEPTDGPWTEVNMEEPDDFILPKQSIFKPFNKHVEKHIYRLELDDEVITLGVEACKEHLKGRVKQSVKIPIDLQLNLSYGSKVDPTKIEAENFVMADYVVSPKLVTREKIPDNQINSYPVRLYTYHILNKQNGLDGPFMPLYSDEQTILLQLMNLIQRIDNGDETLTPNGSYIYYLASRVKNNLLECIFASQPMDNNDLKNYRLNLEKLKSICNQAEQVFLEELNEIFIKIKILDFTINSILPSKTFNGSNTTESDFGTKRSNDQEAPLITSERDDKELDRKRLKTQ